MEHILTADIGGTNSRFADFQLVPAELSKNRGEGTADALPQLKLVRTLTIPTSSVDSFAQLVETVRETWGDLGMFSRAALAVPGPVTHARRCHLPNVSWGVVDVGTAPQLPPTVLLNDFVAQGWACLLPDVQDLWLASEPMALTENVSAQATLAKPHVLPQTKAIIGAGTGLGLCALLPGSPPRVMASEGGHALFPFVPASSPQSSRCMDESVFADFLQQRAGSTAVELVIAGRGLSHLHAFHTGEEKSPAEVAAVMHTTPVLEDYARFFGRICQNWLLYTTGSGGLYIAGGIAASNPDILRHPAFWQALYDAQKHETMLRATPVYLVRNTQSALWGAALCAVMEEC